MLSKNPPKPVSSSPGRRKLLGLTFLLALCLGACSSEPGTVQEDPASHHTNPDAPNASSAAQETPAILAPIHGLMAAFNAHDAAAMTQFVAEELVWSSVTADSLGVEAKGREALEEGMSGYFAALPSVRSAIEDVHVSGSYVSVGERVRWEVTAEDGAQESRSQRAMAVYHVADGLIQSVWYFPAEP